MDFDENGKLIIPDNYVSEEEADARKFEEKKAAAKIRAKAYYSRFDYWQKRSLPTAQHHMTQWTEDEIKVLVGCDRDDNDQILSYAKQIRRTWWAVKLLLDELHKYQKSGSVRPFLQYLDGDGELKVRPSMKLIMEMSEK